MGYLFLIICLAGLLAGVGLFVYILRGYRKDKKRRKLTKQELQRLLIGWIAFGVSGIFFPLAVNELSSWNGAAGNMVLACLGAFLFFVSMSLLWGSFYVYFYRPKTEFPKRKIFLIAMLASIPVALIGMLLNLGAVAGYLEYPLAAGFCINSNGIHLFTAQNQNDEIHAGGLHIAWYGVIIVFSALVAYWIGDHQMYKKYGRHGIFESTLLVAFPAGVIGARIWYVVGNWEVDGFSENFGKVFQIWNGGLTILGGAVGGILAGAIWFLLRRKYIDLRIAIDFALPTILLSQAIGRWGNFFNLEVYGTVVQTGGGWSWIPEWISNQMQYFARYKDIPTDLDMSLVNGLKLVPGYMNAPLFLVESLFNLAGFLIIYFLVPAVWKKHRAPGINLGLYLTYYGIVRISMEGLRNPNFNMGVNGNWSVINAGIYIGLGVLFLAFFEAFYFYRLKKGLPLEIIRGQAPKSDKPVKKKSAIDIVAEASIKEPNQEENPENPAETAPNEGENDGRENS